LQGEKEFHPVPGEKIPKDIQRNVHLAELYPAVMGVPLPPDDDGASEMPGQRNPDQVEVKVAGGTGRGKAVALLPLVKPLAAEIPPELRRTHHQGRIEPHRRGKALAKLLHRPKRGLPISILGSRIGHGGKQSGKPSGNPPRHRCGDTVLSGDLHHPEGGLPPKLRRYLLREHPFRKGPYIFVLIRKKMPKLLLILLMVLEVLHRRLLKL
jgi:hypothetical protein